MSNGIGPNPLNPLSKIYLEQIVEKKDDSYLEPDMKKRQKNNEKARKDMEKMGTSMKNPHFEEKQQGWDAVNSLADAYKAMQKEGYGAPGHNPGSGEKSVARAKALMDKKGQKGAPGLDAMAAAKKEHEARRGVKKEEVEVEEGYDEPKMHSAVKRVMTTQPAAKGRAASRLHSKYSMRSKGNVAGETDGPGPNAPKRSGRKGRGSETDRGSGNAAKRRMSTEALDPVGKEDGDVNNDGKKDSTDSYLMKRRKAIGNAMKKKLKESRSLAEVMTDTEDEKPIKEKKVNNKITINPKLGEAVEDLGGELLEMTEVDEAVYGGTPKEEPKDTRMTVTAADKKGGTLAYKRFKAGDKRYKSADHMKEGIRDEDPEKGTAERKARLEKKRGMKMDDHPQYKKEDVSLGKSSKNSEIPEEMSPQEIQLQKKKATIDKMIAQRRKTELAKGKAPTKTMDEGKGDPCWDTHVMKGMKKKGNRMVPNCVPKEGFVSEEDSDRMKDRRLERGGVGGNTDYSRPPGKPNLAGKKKPKSGGMSALDFVKAEIRKKHGQGAIMDTKKK